MGKIVGGITDAVGLTDHEGERKAAKAASSANSAAIQLSKEQLEMAKAELQFQKDQYQDWKNIYGDMQENLGNYYKNLDPDQVATMGLQNQQREYQQVRNSIERDFAQRGLTNSGQETSSLATTAVQNATARASIRENAAQATAERKMQFLGLGLGQGTQMLGLVGNASNNVTNAFSSAVNSRTNMANSYLNSSTQLSMANMKAMQDVAGAGLFYGMKK